VIFFLVVKEVQVEVWLQMVKASKSAIKTQKFSVLWADRNVSNAFPFGLSFVLKKKAAVSSETLVVMHHRSLSLHGGENLI
jgi:hypothetical protein